MPGGSRGAGGGSQEGLRGAGGGSHDAEGGPVTPRGGTLTCWGLRPGGVQAYSSGAQPESSSEPLFGGGGKWATRRLRERCSSGGTPPAACSPRGHWQCWQIFLRGGHTVGGGDTHTVGGGPHPRSPHPRSPHPFLFPCPGFGGVPPHYRAPHPILGVSTFFWGSSPPPHPILGVLKPHHPAWGGARTPLHYSGGVPSHYWPPLILGVSHSILGVPNPSHTLFWGGVPHPPTIF